MICRKIMLIRHAEKPDDAGKLLGVDSSGRPDSKSLTVPEQAAEVARALAASASVPAGWSASSSVRSSISISSSSS
jgi:hypothetical protein